MSKHSETEVRPILLFNETVLEDQNKGWETYLSIQNSLVDLSSFNPTIRAHFDSSLLEAFIQSHIRKVALIKQLDLAFIF